MKKRTAKKVVKKGVSKKASLTGLSAALKNESPKEGEVKESKKLVVKSKLDRPILAMYECLLHLEEAKRHLDRSHIFSGPDSTKMQKLMRGVENGMEELIPLYRKYWRELNIEFEGAKNV